MNRTLLTLIITPFLIGTAVAASGYAGPGASASITTVSAALAAPDDTPVVLQGVIVKKIKHDRYEFRDTTGSITVEIDDEHWPQQRISEHTQVKLIGEVEHDLLGREIDVKQVQLVN
jgi:uncharacterized protein (TIGR00156 family)